MHTTHFYRVVVHCTVITAESEGPRESAFRFVFCVTQTLIDHTAIPLLPWVLLL